MSSAVLNRPLVQLGTTRGAPEGAAVGVESSPTGRGAPTAVLRSQEDMTVFIVIYVAALLLLLFIVLAMRLAHPTAFAWGQKLMNVPLATGGIAGLLISAAAAGFAVPLTRVGAARSAALALLVAFIGGAAFVGLTLADRDAKWSYGIRPDERFRPNERYVARAFGVKLPKTKPVYVPTVAAATDAPAARSIDPINGRKLFLGTCAGCHAADGSGMPGQGKSLIGNEFVKSKSDSELLKFLQAGRQPWDPLNTTKVQMPPRGGNPTLTDADLNDVVAYVRTLQSPGGDGTAAGTLEQAGASNLAAEGVTIAAPEPVFIERSVIPPPPAGPAGMGGYFQEVTRARWAPPADAVVFADTYYLLTTCQALQTGALALAALGLAVLAWWRRLDATRPQAVIAVAVLSGLSALFWLVTAPLTYFV